MLFSLRWNIIAQGVACYNHVIKLNKIFVNSFNINNKHLTNTQTFYLLTAFEVSAQRFRETDHWWVQSPAAMLNCLGVASRGSRPFFRPLAILVLARLRQATTHSFPLLRLVERGRDERHVYLALFLRGRSGAFLKEQQSPETCILKSSLEQFGEYPRDAFFSPQSAFIRPWRTCRVRFWCARGAQLLWE